MSRRDIYVMSKRRPMAATLVALAGALLYADVASDAIRRIAKGMATVAQVVKWNRLQEECVIQFPGQNGRQHEASPSPPSTQIRFADQCTITLQFRTSQITSRLWLSALSKALAGTAVALVCFAYGDEVELDDADPLLESLQLAKEVGVEALGNVAVNNTKQLR